MALLLKNLDGPTMIAFHFSEFNMPFRLLVRNDGINQTCTLNWITVGRGLIWLSKENGHVGSIIGLIFSHNIYIPFIIIYALT